MERGLFASQAFSAGTNSGRIRSKENADKGAVHPDIPCFFDRRDGTVPLVAVDRIQPRSEHVDIDRSLQIGGAFSAGGLDP